MRNRRRNLNDSDFGSYAKPQPSNESVGSSSSNNYTNNNNNNKVGQKNKVSQDNDSQDVLKSDTVGDNKDISTDSFDKNGDTSEGHVRDPSSGSKSRIQDKSSLKDGTSNDNYVRNNRFANRSTASESDGAHLKDKRQNKDIAQKLKGSATKGAVATAAPVAAKAGLSAAAAVAVKSLIQTIIALIKGFIAAVKRVIVGVFSTVARWFTAAAGWVARALSINIATAATMFVIMFGLLTRRIRFALIGHNYLYTDEGCNGKRYNPGNVQTIEAQMEALAAYAEEVCSHDPAYPYKTASKVTGEESSLPGGYVCNQFVAHCFMHEDSEVYSEDVRDCTAIYDEFLDYDVDDTTDKKPIPLDEMQRGDILLFSKGGLEDDNPTHTAIYLGDNRIAHAQDEAHGMSCSDLKYDEATGKCYSGKYVVKVTRPYDEKESSSDGDGGGSGTVTPSASQKEFIEWVGKEARSLWKPYHMYPSVIIAQAALESSWGTSPFAQQRNNLFGINAVDKNPNKAYTYSKKEAVEAAHKNYWKRADYNRYKAVILSSSAKSQAKNARKSGWSSGHYLGEGSYNYQGRSLVEIIDQYDLTKWDKGLSDFKPDMSKYAPGDSAVDTMMASVNSAINSLNSNDGCRGSKKDNTDEEMSRGSTASDENATWIKYDEQKLESEIGKQKSNACRVWAQAYAQFIIKDGNFNFDRKNAPVLLSFDVGTCHWLYQKVSWKDRSELIWEEVVEEKRPVVVARQGSAGNHFVTVIRVRKGVSKSSVKPEDFVVLDPFAGDAKSRRNFYRSHRWMKGFNFNGSSYGHETLTYENVK